MNYLRQLNRPVTSVLKEAAKMTTRIKPPNIFIYDGAEGETDAFRALKSSVESVVARDSYIVYHLTRPNVQRQPWPDHAQVLIVAEGTPLELDVIDSIKRYVDGSGSAVLTLCSEIDQSFALIKERYSFEGEIQLRNGDRLEANGEWVYTEGEGVIGLASWREKAVVLRINVAEGVVLCTSVKSVHENLVLLGHLLRELGLSLNHDRSEISLSPMYLFNTATINDDVIRELTQNLKKINDEKSVQIFTDTKTSAFDIDVYRQYLDTKSLGKVLLFCEVIASTNDTLENLMCKVDSGLGLAVVASRQTKGRGRSGNAWISPQGSALFSYLVPIALRSNLGGAIAIVQHIAALAAVLAVEEVTGAGRLRLKWPNDIYTDDGRKLGGILVKSSLFQTNVLAVVGCGLNVNNDKPTVSLKQLQGSEVRIERLIASTLTQSERLVDSFQIDKSKFLNEYYERWLHSNQEVVIIREGKKEVRRILGLDENGYLCVADDNGQLESVHPDGNSLDMMHGLIYAKS